MKYIIYGDELSLFTRKLECACLFYGLDFERREKTSDIAVSIEQRAGTHQVPVLHTPENWMLADTTPTLSLLDSRHPGRALFPSGIDGATVHLMEEFFDEWVARVMVHFRWHYPASAEFAAARMSAGDVERAAQLKDWGRRSCRATGTEFPAQQRAAEQEYLDLMAAADEQLRHTPYLLGARPSALDCCVLGGLRAHTLMDPDPRPHLARFETLIDWSTRRAHAGTPVENFPTVDCDTPFARYVLAKIADTYQPFAIANAAALRAGAKLFQAPSYGESVTYLCRKYPERSRAMLRARVATLDVDERKAFAQLLAANRLTDCLN